MPRTIARSTTAGSTWPKSSAPSGRPCSPICGNTWSASATASGGKRVEQIDDEILDCAAATYDHYAIDELRRAAQDKGHWAEKSDDEAEKQKLVKLRQDLDKAWGPKLYLGHKSKDDLLKEMDSVVRVPGWSNIWTQPIINRIDMLATGVRTPIGVKVFGDNLDQIQKVSEEVAEALKSVQGRWRRSRPDQGKGYLEIRPDRDRAARYGVNVGESGTWSRWPWAARRSRTPSKAANGSPSGSATPAACARTRRT